MKSLKAMTGTAATAIARGEVATPPSAPLSSVDDQTGEVVEKIFRQLQAIFPAWKQAWPNEKTLATARRSWTKGFMDAGISSIEQIEFGIKKCRRSGSPFAPSIGQFVQWCKPTPELLGIPSHDRAYAEAIGNAHPSMVSNREWSHQAVYHAAAHCGFRSLSTMPAEASRKMFDRAYDITIRMLLAGDPLRSIPLALPRPAPSRGSEKVANEALALLRKSLGARGRG